MPRHHHHHQEEYRTSPAPVAILQYATVPEKNGDVHPTYTTPPRRIPIHTSLFTNPSGGNMEMKCAWCYHLNKAHNHTTPNCEFFKNAEVADRWHVAYRNRLCQSCLLPGHYWKDCQPPKTPCTLCTFPHHPTLECRPEEQISPHINNQ